MKNIKAVLFDFDGTLMNTSAFLFAAYNYAFNKVFKRDITYDEIHVLFGRPLYSSLADFGEENQDALFRAYNEFDDHGSYPPEPYTCAAEGVKMLRAAGFITGIVTSRGRNSLSDGVRAMGLDDTYFDVYITPEDTERHKPLPDPILEACRRLGIKPEECIYVGDSVFDLECACAAGAVPVGVNYSTSRDALLTYNPAFMADSIVELAEILNNNEKNS